MCAAVPLSTLAVVAWLRTRGPLARGADPKSGRKADREGAPPHPSEQQGTPPLSRWGLLFLFEQFTSSPPDYYYGVPSLLTAVFILALVSAVLTVGVVVCASLSWWGRFWSVGWRVHYSLVALAALALTWQLVYWNLLGFRA